MLDAKRDGRIDVTELCQFLRERGLKVKKVRQNGRGGRRRPGERRTTHGDQALPGLQSEAEAMLWEVDEDCDGCVNWAEFRQMYERCQADQTGAPAARGLRAAPYSGLCTIDQLSSPPSSASFDLIATPPPD